MYMKNNPLHLFFNLDRLDLNINPNFDLLIFKIAFTPLTCSWHSTGETKIKK